VLFGNHIPMGFSRDRVHVLLSLDTEKSDITNFPDVVRGGDTRRRGGVTTARVDRSTRRSDNVRRPAGAPLAEQRAGAVQQGRKAAGHSTAARPGRGQDRQTCLYFLVAR
jgi:hypothetical protein